MFGHEHHLCEDVGAAQASVGAVEDDGAGAGRKGAHNQLQQGGLAGAVGGEEAADHAFGQLEAQVVDDRAFGAAVAE